MTTRFGRYDLTLISLDTTPETRGEILQLIRERAEFEIPDTGMEKLASIIGRFNANRTLEPLKKELEFDLKFYPGYPPMNVNPDHAWVAEVRGAVERGMGFLPRISGAQGSLDQAYATEKTRIPTCVYGVGRQLESNIHGLNENVRLTDLEGFAQFLIELLRA